MKLISFEEYDALKAYMEPKLLELWRHENEVRKEQGIKELNSFQIGFPINEIYHYYAEGDHDFYIVFNVSCHRLLQEGIIEALEAFPEKFGTGNAMDVVDALYEGSIFKNLGDKDRFIEFLAENACCYVVYTNEEGFGDILRLDTFRKVDERNGKQNVYDFTGGLMHVLKHFSYEGRNLAIGKDVHDLFDLEHLVYLIAMAFRLKEGEKCIWKATQELIEGPMHAVFYKEEATGFYFLKTYHRVKKEQQFLSLTRGKERKYAYFHSQICTFAGSKSERSLAIQNDVLQSTPLISKSLPIRFHPSGNLLLLSQIARIRKNNGGTFRFPSGERLLASNNSYLCDLRNRQRITMSHSSLISELKARGMIHNIMPGTEEQLTEHLTTAYVGFDPTADSLHIGHLVGVMMLRHLQRAGHKPIALLGGATGMIGDPSMKSQERNLLDMDTLRHNQECIGRQLGHFLDFESDAPNKALLLNNYDWMKDYSFLNFIRDIGKHITVNYMMAKDSVKRRLEANAEAGLSFTEFSYQLLQGYDYLHLYREYGCRVQMGGSDQWGNITTGTELIRRIDGGEAFGVTCPLIKKADGTKFGKTEKGNVWLDRRYTSPYTFCQFWLNVSDEDAERFVKIFTSIPLEEIDSLIERHRQAPHERLLQHTLAEELTVMVHGREDYEQSMSAGQILFGNNTHDQLRQMPEELLEEVMAGVPRYNVGRTLLEQTGGVKLLDLLVEHAPIFKSKGELRKLIDSNGISLNKEKVADQDCVVTTDDLIAGRYLLVQRGKKNYYLIVVSA